MPRYTGIAVLVLAASLVVRLAWQGSHYILHPQQRRSAAAGFVAPGPGSNAHLFAPWESDAILSLDAGVQDAGAGKMMAAEMDVDRAASIITAMRLQSRPASPPFFEVSIATLDRVARGAIAQDRQQAAGHIGELAAQSLQPRIDRLDDAGVDADTDHHGEAPLLRRAQACFTASMIFT